MTWLYYLLEANLYLAVFYGFYHLFLHKETFYTLNRYYLICATLLAFALPVLQVTALNKLLSEQTDQVLIQVITNKAAENTPTTISKIIVACYFAVAAVLIARFVNNIFKIILLSLKGQKQKSGRIIYVELANDDTAFSFFNLLFINPKISEKSTILKHEMVHITQHHSFDIIFFELIRIINWFNPISWMIRKDIKLLHEYIADEATTEKDVQKHDYAMFLIQHSFGIVPNQLTNQIFNQSILKRRINMLNKEKSPEKTRLRLLLVLPLIGGMLCTSTMAFTKDYAVDLYPEKQDFIRTLLQDTTKKKVHIKQSKTKTNPEQFIVPPPTKAKAGENKKVTKHKNVKFPPPIIKPDSKQVPPPPPAEPNTPPPPPVAPVAVEDLITVDSKGSTQQKSQKNTNQMETVVILETKSAPKKNKEVKIRLKKTDPKTEKTE
jgi:hypothetical protein